MCLKWCWPRSLSCISHWGRVTHICVSKLTIIGSDNGLSPDRCQAIIWTNAGLLLIGPLGTNFSEIFIEILTFSFKKMRLKVSSAKRQPFRLGLNVIYNRSNHNQVVKVACSIVMPQLTLKHLLKWHFIVVHSSVLHGWALISNLKDIASKMNAWHQLMWLKLVLILRYAGAQHKYIFIHSFLSL